MTDRRRVVVTGMGALTALGNDVASTWAGLVAGRSGIRTIEAFDPSRLTSQIAGEVHDFDSSGVLDRKELRRTDRYIQFGLVAARQALDQAGLPERFEGELAERTGVILGTGLGGVGTLIDGISTNALRGPDRISPFLIPMGIPNIGAGQVAINFGMTGPNFTTVSACATGGHAIGEACEIIRRGDADVMVAGGDGGRHLRAARRRVRVDARAVDAQRRPGGARRARSIAGATGSSSARAPASSSSRRSSTPRRAARRSSPSSSATARPPTRRTSRCRRRAGSAPSGPPGGRSRRPGSTAARHRPRQRPRDLDARGRQGRAPGDPDDLRRRAPASVSVTANKSMLGHTLGAAGAIEAIVTILTIREGCVPPTINLDDPDPEAAGLDLTPNVAQRRDIRIALSNSFGFGGQNTALIFARWDA